MSGEKKTSQAQRQVPQRVIELLHRDYDGTLDEPLPKEFIRILEARPDPLESGGSEQEETNSGPTHGDVGNPGERE